MAGYNVRLPKVAQPPYSTPDCCNVWVKDSVINNGRLGGGSRPGLLRSYRIQKEDLSYGAIINPVMMNVLRCYRPESSPFATRNYLILDEQFSGNALNNAWTYVGDDSDGQVTVSPFLPRAGQVQTKSTYIYQDVSILDSVPYCVEALLLPFGVQSGIVTFAFFLCMNNADPVIPDPINTPVDANGLYIGFEFHNGTDYTVNLVGFTDGVETDSATYSGTIGTANVPFSGWLRVELSGGTATVFIRDLRVVNAYGYTAGGNWGTRTGFQMVDANTLEVGIERFRLQYYPESGVTDRLRYQLFASGNGASYAQNGFDGKLEPLFGAITLASGYPLASTANQGKLYIGDYGDKTAGEMIFLEYNQRVDSYEISADGLVTIVTHNTNHLTTGVRVVVAVRDDSTGDEPPAGVNGTHIITVVDNTTFTYQGVNTGSALGPVAVKLNNAGMEAPFLQLILPAPNIVTPDIETDMVLLEGSVNPPVPARAYKMAYADTSVAILTENAVVDYNSMGLIAPQQMRVGRAPKYYDPNLSSAESIQLWNTDLYADDELPLDIVGLQLVSNVAQVTTSVPHGLSVGDTVTVNQDLPICAPAPYTNAAPAYPFNGTWTVKSVPSSTAFTYDCDADDIPAANAKGRWAVQLKRRITNTERMVSTTVANTLDYAVGSADVVVVELDPPDSTFDGRQTLTGESNNHRFLYTSAVTGTAGSLEATGGMARSCGGTVVKQLGRKGVVPWNCTIMVLYRGRICSAGDRENPQQFYMSRIGDPYDYDYGVDSSDTARAYTSTLSKDGEIGDTITAVIPVNDDYMIFGCVSSLWLMRGDPAAGGLIDNISRTVGIVSSTAWCYLPNNAGILFMANNGIWLWSPGQEMVNITHDTIPNSFINLNPAQFQITMMWDTYWRAAHIYMTPLNAGSKMYHWWVWMEEGKPALWPMTYAPDHEPLFLADYRPENNTDNAVLMLGRDGHIRQFWNGAWTDDLTSDSNNGIKKYITIGPIRLGGDELHRGLLNSIEAVLPQRSAIVQWELFVGNSALSALPVPLIAGIGNNTRSAYGQFAPLRSYRSRPNKAGVDAYIRLQPAEQMPWAYESMLVVKEQQGVYNRTSRTGR